MTPPKTIAIVGAGIAGATAAQTLSKYTRLTIHVFDQGRRGVGGRSSSRSVESQNDDDATMKWDHGCQFFRADVPRFEEMVKVWMADEIVSEWKGKFFRPSYKQEDREFFGLPSTPPFYVGRDGMQSVAQGVLSSVERKLSPPSSSTTLRVFTGTRVARLEREGDSRHDDRRWKLYGTSGMAAYHDTPEKIARLTAEGPLGEGNAYDAVILTYVSSSFGGWHRASAGVPEDFAARVRRRVGARTPLFSAMVAFDGRTDIPFDAASFVDPIVWFAARSGSKPGMGNGRRECWTIVSTPEYAMKKIEETPMQDPKSGEFIPQSKEYLTSVPGPDLFYAFKWLLRERGGMLGENALDELPDLVHMDAQRWGSAMPHPRHLDDASPTRRVISGVPYDCGRFPLAPTREEEQGDGQSFLADEGHMLFQAGDMMSCYTPGFEGAALSGHDAAEHLYRILNAS